LKRVTRFKEKKPVFLILDTNPSLKKKEYLHVTEGVWLEGKGAPNYHQEWGLSEEHSFSTFRKKKKNGIREREKSHLKGKKGGRTS